jgi:CheY-like chemotaxis protein
VGHVPQPSPRSTDALHRDTVESSGVAILPVATATGTMQNERRASLGTRSMRRDAPVNLTALPHSFSEPATMFPMKTFIVEDSPVILDSLVSALEELTEVRVVGTAADQETAVSWMRNAGTNCDLVIIDIFLKSGSGFGVLKAIDEMASPAKRIILTNYATSELRSRCAKLGADRVFDKSGELESLITYCGRIADGSTTKPGELR